MPGSLLWKYLFESGGGGGGGGSGPAVGDGMLLENGTDFVLLETGDFLLLE